ncbi:MULTISPECIES: hypothetical protein [unclassified Streptomyces]|nr:MULTISPECIES: hypothetical protein [unclassified Streptomyces]MBD3011254.1 hypothetical protein [Streptomyces sp. 5-10]
MRDREQALRWHSIAVLWKFYAKLLWAQRHRANQLIDDALNNMPDNAE